MDARRRRRVATLPSSRSGVLRLVQRELTRVGVKVEESSRSGSGPFRAGARAPNDERRLTGVRPDGP